MVLSNTEIQFYALAGVSAFLFIVLFAIVIQLYVKVKKLVKENNYDEEEIEEQEHNIPQPKPAFTLPKPALSRWSQQGNNDLPKRNPVNDFRNEDILDDFNNLDFDDRRSIDRPHQPERPQVPPGKPYKNPMFGDNSESKFDYGQPKKFDRFADRANIKPQIGAGFKVPSALYNNINSERSAPNEFAFPRRDYQRQHY